MQRGWAATRFAGWAVLGSSVVGRRFTIAVPAKSEGCSPLGGDGLDAFEKRLGGARERCVAAVDEQQLALDSQLRHVYLYEIASRELFANSEAGDKSDSVAHGDEALDGFEAGQFHIDVERSLVLREERDDAAPERGDDIVGDEIFGAEIAECDFLLAREGVPRIHDEDDGVCVDADRFELRIFRREGYDSELDIAAEDMLGDFAGEGALYQDRDMRALAAKAVEHGQQIEAGVFVGGEVEVSTLEGSQLFESRGGFAAQLDEALGIFAQQFAGSGERAFARGALEKRLADFLFEATDGVTDRRLGTVKARRGTRKAALFNDGEEGFELRKVHISKSAPPRV